MEQKPKTIFIVENCFYNDGSVGIIKMQHHEGFDGPINKQNYKVVEYTETYEVLQRIKYINMKEYTLISNKVCTIEDGKIVTKQLASSSYVNRILLITEDCTVTNDCGYTVTAKAGEAVVDIFGSGDIKEHTMVVITGEAAKTLHEKEAVRKARTGEVSQCARA